VTELLVLTDAQVGELVDYGEAIEVIENAFRDFGQGRATMPSKVYVSFPNYQGDIRAMPAATGDVYAGVKLVNSHEQNPSKGLPAVVGTYLLFSQETGMPLCLMAATLLTAVRTGAASGVATRYMGRDDARSVGLIGAGVQAAHQLRAVSRVRSIERVVVWARDVDRARTEALVDGLGTEFPHLQIRIADLVAEAAGSDIICTTTPSRAPLFPAGAVRSGAHINAVGADGPGKQELDPELLKAARVVVDELDQAIHGGEVNVALSTNAITVEQIAGTLSEVVAGAIPGRTSPTETTVFDSTGLAIEDIAVAILVYERALERGLGSTINL
jgi:alanine dehydrogenase